MVQTTATAEIEIAASPEAVLGLLVDSLNESLRRLQAVAEAS